MTLIVRWDHKNRQDRLARVARLEQRIDATDDPQLAERLRAQVNYLTYRASDPKRAAPLRHPPPP
jgi:hypothetical protein